MVLLSFHSLILRGVFAGLGWVNEWNLIVVSHAGNPDQPSTGLEFLLQVMDLENLGHGHEKLRVLLVYSVPTG